MNNIVIITVSILENYLIPESYDLDLVVNGLLAEHCDLQVCVLFITEATNLEELVTRLGVIGDCSHFWQHRMCCGTSIVIIILGSHDSIWAYFHF